MALTSTFVLDDQSSWIGKMFVRACVIDMTARCIPRVRTCVRTRVHIQVRRYMTANCYAHVRA